MAVSEGLQIGQVYNLGLSTIINRLQRMVIEASKSASAGVPYHNKYDLDRQRSYLKNLSAKMDFMKTEGALDMPKSQPVLIPLLEDPEVPPVQSINSQEYIKHLQAMVIELRNCDSARIAGGIIVYDESRLTGYIDHAMKLLDFFENEELNPLDQPESTPTVPVAPEGAKGV